MLPCSRVNHVKMKKTPGPLYKKIVQAWSNDVGVDIIAQAKKYHNRKSNIWHNAT